MITNNKRAFAVELDKKLADNFSAFVKARGLKKSRTLEGAIRAFMVLSPELQSKLIADNVSDVYAMLVEGLVETEILKHLNDLGPAKEYFLALLKQTKATKPHK